jgi:hypothetical protein
MTRKRINLSVDEKTYTELEKIRRRGGWPNLCRMSVAAIHAMILKQTKRRHTVEKKTITAEISEEFAAMTDAEGVDYDVHYKPDKKTEGGDYGEV